MSIQLSDYQYDLPQELIAQHPLVERGASRLLQLCDDGIRHGVFTDLLDHLQPGDILVLNNTRVIKARMFGLKDTGGQAEILLERLLGSHDALCQIRVSKPVKEGAGLTVGATRLVNQGRDGQFYHLHSDEPILDLLERDGHVPLPPYIQRSDELLDDERYQTVFGQIPGAVAAPTAGLHFDRQLLQQIEDKGVELAEVTLHVGAGTFQPVRGDLDAHEMHTEVYEISEHAAQQINRTRERGGRVVAVGTTVVRTLESAWQEHGGLRPCSGETQLFIKPGFEFQVVDVLVTNFHLPASTLLMLVCAFAGYEEVMGAYAEAIRERYRFFSYGDAQLLFKSAAL